MSNSALTDLIDSLSKSEKKSISIYAKRHTIHGANKYYMLYKAYCKGWEDTTVLKGKLFKSQSELSVYKNYLYKIILSGLENIHTNTDAKITSIIRQSEILFSKKLFADSLKIIEKGKAIAKKNERWTYLAELYRIEFECHRALSYKLTSDIEIAQLFHEINCCFEKSLNTNGYRKVTVELFNNIYQKGYLQNEEMKNSTKKIMETELLQNISNAKTYYAEFCYLHCHNAYNFSIGNYALSLKYNKKLLELLDENPHQYIERPGQYISVLTNTIINEMHLKLYNDALKNIKRFRAFNAEGINDSFVLILTLEMECLGEMGGYSKMDSVLADAKRIFSHSGFEMFNKQYVLTLKYTLASAYFGRGDYRNAKVWLNDLLNEHEENIRADIYTFSKFLYTLVLFEQNMIDLLENELLSLKRYLIKMNNFNEAEKMFIDGMIKLLENQFSDKSVKKHFSEMLSKIQELKKAEDTESSFDLQTWLKSKIENKTYAQIKEDRYRFMNRI